jgi:hypothetical protein
MSNNQQEKIGVSGSPFDTILIKKHRDSNNGDEVEADNDSLGEFQMLTKNTTPHQKIIDDIRVSSKTLSKKKSRTSRKRKRRNLALRTDVMNKNIFRAIKRELKSEF